MNLSDVMTLRPQQRNSASFRAALARAERTKTELLERAAERQAWRKQSLLTATDDEIAAAERDVRDAQLAADRISALIDALQEEMQVVLQEEAQSDRLAAMQRTREKSAAFEAAFLAEYEKAATAIRRLCELEDEAWRAFGEASIPTEEFATVRIFGRQHVNFRIGPLIQLPGTSGETGQWAIWWPEHLRRN